jgi:hypothetical protein
MYTNERLTLYFYVLSRLTLYFCTSTYTTCSVSYIYYIATTSVLVQSLLSHACLPISSSRSPCVPACLQSKSLVYALWNASNIKVVQTIVLLLYVLHILLLLVGRYHPNDVILSPAFLFPLSLPVCLWTLANSFSKSDRRVARSLLRFEAIYFLCNITLAIIFGMMGMPTILGYVYFVNCFLSSLVVLFDSVPAIRACRAPRIMPVLALLYYTALFIILNVSDKFLAQIDVCFFQFCTTNRHVALVAITNLLIFGLKYAWTSIKQAKYGKANSMLLWVTCKAVVVQPQETSSRTFPKIVRVLPDLSRSEIPTDKSSLRASLMHMRSRAVQAEAAAAAATTGEDAGSADDPDADADAVHVIHPLASTQASGSPRSSAVGSSAGLAGIIIRDIDSKDINEKKRGVKGNSVFAARAADQGLGAAWPGALRELTEAEHQIVSKFSGFSVPFTPVFGAPWLLRAASHPASQLLRVGAIALIAGYLLVPRVVEVPLAVEEAVQIAILVTVPLALVVEATVCDATMVKLIMSKLESWVVFLNILLCAVTFPLVRRRARGASDVLFVTFNVFLPSLFTFALLLDAGVSYSHFFKRVYLAVAFVATLATLYSMLFDTSYMKSIAFCLPPAPLISAGLCYDVKGLCVSSICQICLFFSRYLWKIMKEPDCLMIIQAPVFVKSCIASRGNQIASQFGDEGGGGAPLRDSSGGDSDSAGAATSSSGGGGGARSPHREAGIELTSALAGR